MFTFDIQIALASHEFELVLISFWLVGVYAQHQLVILGRFSASELTPLAAPGISQNNLNYRSFQFRKENKIMHDAVLLGFTYTCSLFFLLCVAFKFYKNHQRFTIGFVYTYEFSP